MPYRKLSRTCKDFEDIIHQVANKLNISIIQHVVTLGSDEDLDNILGDVHKVVVKGLRNGQKIQVGFVVKWISDPKRRISFRNLYHREYTFYYHVVPKFREVQSKIIEGLKMTFPECIFASMETLVLSPLLSQGFKLHDRFRIIDFEHSSLVVKNLAKMHALFFVLRHTNPNECEVIKLLYQEDVQYSIPECIPKSILNFYNDSVNVITDLDAKQTLKELESDIFSILHKSVRPDPKYSTLCHADCWNNNIFFKYQGERPIDVIFSDYLMSRYASPVTDVSYFLYMTGDQKFLDNNYDRLISLYHKTLAAVLRQCNLDVEDVYPERVFQQHLEEYSVFGLIEALISLKIITAVSEEVVELAEMRYEINDKVSYNSKSQNQSLFIERVNGVVNDFFKRGYSLHAVLNK